MLKTLSAAVLAVSVLAAPAAFAGTHAPRASHHHHRAHGHFNLHHKFGMHKTAFKHVAKHTAPSAKIVRKHG